MLIDIVNTCSVIFRCTLSVYSTICATYMTSFWNVVMTTEPDLLAECKDKSTKSKFL